MKKLMMLLILSAVILGFTQLKIVAQDKPYIELEWLPTYYTGAIAKYDTNLGGMVFNLNFGIPAEGALFIIGAQVLNQDIDSYGKAVTGTAGEYYSGDMKGVNLFWKARIYLTK